MTDTPNIADLGMLRVDDYRDQDGIVFLTGLLDRYGECVRYQTGVGRFIVINHPSVVHELSRNDNFRRLSFLQIVLGQGLLTSEGAWWRRQRQLAQPMFTPERVSAFGDLWTAQTLERLPAWRAHADSGEPLDVADEMTRLALNIVLRALFGYEVAEKPVLELLQALQAVMADMSELATTAFAASQTMTPARQRAFRDTMGVLERTVADIIARRRGATATPDDLLTRLMTSRIEETGELLSDRQIRDEIVTLLVAGHETTSLALDWTWYLLDRNPQAEARLHEELDATLRGRTPSIDDLPRLGWTAMVVKEALRMYPPVWYFNRRARREGTIGNIPIAAGEIIAVCVYSVHRHRDFWRNQETFDPSRFSDVNPDRRQLKAFVPFGSGRHLCLGIHFALMESALILATLAQRFRVRPIPGRPVAMEPGLTLRMHGGLPARIEHRIAGNA